MIHFELLCDDRDKPGSRDARKPCDSASNRNVKGQLDKPIEDLPAYLRDVAVRAGWFRVMTRNYGRRMGYICANCKARRDAA